MADNLQSPFKTFKSMVMLTPVVPAFPADNAGSRYIYSVAEIVQKRFSFVALAQDGAAAQRALKIGRTAPHKLLSRPLHTARRFSGWTDRWAKIVRPMRVPSAFVKSLKADPDLLNLVREADVLDLQWAEMGTLIPFLRSINRDARIVCTFHDVVSQRFARARDEADSPARRLRWEWAVRRALSAEKKIMRQADTVVVLSEKDAGLLPVGPAQVEVVAPPLTTETDASGVSPSSSPEILFVGNLARWENEQGLLWFIEDVWPMVKARVPHAQLLVAGAGASPRVHDAAAIGDIDLLGFVANLEPLYSRASVAVAPLHLGAGVKFKVVEAILAGLPVVTTPVGAEGIGDISWFAGIHGSPSAFATSVSEVLLDPQRAKLQASCTQAAAHAFYGWEKFEKTLERVYSSGPATQGNVILENLDPENLPDVSVVVPVHNGAATLDQQLQALVDQATHLSFEVVISDNGSTDATREVAARWKDRFFAFAIVDSGQQRGASYARNEGTRVARAAKILFCDADDVVDANWVEALAGALDEHSLVGGAVRMTYPSTSRGNQQSSALSEGLNSIFGFLPYALAGACGVRRDALLSVGGFDSSYPAGHEEADLSWRLQLAGFTIGWCPSAILEYRQRPHHSGAARQRYYYAKSSILLWTRFAGDQPLSAVSFKGSLRHLVSGLLQAPRLISARTRREQSLSLGWKLGIVSGHLTYRLLGKVPPRQLMEVER